MHSRSRWWFAPSALLALLAGCGPLPEGDGGSLRVLLDDPGDPGTITLSAPPGTDRAPLDWSHWGRARSTDWNHKDLPSPLIANFTRTGTLERTAGLSNRFCWVEGSPVATASGVPAGVSLRAAGSHFELQVKAAPTARRLILFLGVTRARGKLTARLSDAAAPPPAPVTLTSDTGSTESVATVEFSSPTAGATVAVRWALDSEPAAAGGSRLTLAAAVLEEVSRSAADGGPRD